jgi:excisionase family DNA binding protein
MIVPKNPPSRESSGTAETESRFEPLLDSREAAALLRMHHKTLERLSRQGRIPGYYYNHRWYFRKSELDAWLHTAVHSSSQSVRVRRIQ